MLHGKLTSHGHPRSAKQRAERNVSREPSKLRELASWFREYAERTGNPAIWDARIRTAEDLEAEAVRLEAVTKTAPAQA